MKNLFLTILISLSIFMSNASSCNKEYNKINTENNASMNQGRIKIKVGSKTFTVTLSDNNSAKEFRKMLPITITMTELNGNEKYYDLPNSLPRNLSNTQMIKTGDLMLYGSKTLVLFYKTFSTSYSYTKLGTVNDVSGLATALGSGNVPVTFELE